MMWLKGDRVKTLDNKITGIVDADMGDWVVIREDHEDRESNWNKDDLAVFKKGEYHPVKDNTWKEIIGY